MFLITLLEILAPKGTLGWGNCENKTFLGELQRRKDAPKGTLGGVARPYHWNRFDLKNLILTKGEGWRTKKVSQNEGRRRKNIKEEA